MSKIGRRAYAEMFGPTTGDRVRLADTELVIADRFRRTIAEDKPTLFAFDQDQWAAALSYAGRRLTPPSRGASGPGGADRAV